MKERTGLGRGKGGGKRWEEGGREKKRCVCVCGKGREGENVREVRERKRGVCVCVGRGGRERM